MTGTNRPLLSIGMIVKNEIRCIERCLKSLQPLRDAIPCELVIADTGSTDGTREIVEQEADVFFDFKWINDFAAARNAVMDRCTGTWFFVIDADEWLAEDISPLLEFVQKRESNKHTAVSVIARNFLEKDDETQYTDFYGVRLMRMATGLRYYGAIHEGWVLSGEVPILNQIMYHDGYVFISGEKAAEKQVRNMALLEQELARDPQNLRRVMQCLEAIRPNGDASCRYARMGVKLVSQKVELWEKFGAAIYRRALQVAHAWKLQEFDTWLADAVTLFPNSPFVRIDCHYTAMLFYYANDDYDKALAEAAACESGYADYDAKRFDPNDIVCSTLHMIDRVSRAVFPLYSAHCYFFTKEYEKARPWLQRVDIETFPLQRIQLLYMVVIALYEHIDISEIFQSLGKRLLDPSNVDPRAQAAGRGFVAQILPAFTPEAMERDPERFALNAIAGMDNEFGRGARILLANSDIEKMEHIVQVEDWTDVPALAIYHILGEKLELSNRFYAQNAEDMERIAGAMASQVGEPITQVVLDWALAIDDPETPAQLTWVLYLVIAALRAEDWENAEACSMLCNLYARCEEEYLEKIYNPDILQEDTIYVLPGMHRFGWFYLQAEKALAEGDEIAYLRNLREGLVTAEAMKPMVKFLSEQLDASHVVAAPPEVSDELLTLARQVREKIANMRRTNDPALQDLLTSEAYQKLKPIIESIGMTAPGGIVQ